MFRELEREVRRLSQPQEIGIDLPLDEDGYLERQCSKCRRNFRVAFNDWSRKISAAAFCPFCGHHCEAGGWHTPAQVEYLRAMALNAVRRRVGAVLERNAAQFNRAHATGGLVEVSMRFEPGRDVTVSLPRPKDENRSRFVCGSCSCHYAADGAVRFCPACRQPTRLGAAL